MARTNGSHHPPPGMIDGVSALLSIVALASGPALILLAQIDAGSASGDVTSLLDRIMKSVWGFYFFAVLGYAIVALAPLTKRSIGRIVTAQIALSAVLLVVFLLVYPLFIGVYPPLLVVVLLQIGPVVVCALVHHHVLKSGEPALHEILAHLTAFLVPTAVIWLSLRATSWLSLLGLVPFAILVIRRNQLISILQFIVMIVVSVGAVYLSKALLDDTGGRERAWLWPVRVPQEYMPPAARRAHIDSLRKVEPGEIVRIGQHEYRVPTNTSTTSGVANGAAIPDRLVYVPMLIRRDQVGLLPRDDGLTAESDFVDLTFIVGTNLPPHPQRLEVEYEDLTISIHRSWLHSGETDEVVKEKVHRCVDSMRVRS